MKVTMDMSNYEIEAVEAEYGDEILCAGWNPDVDSVCQQLQVVESGEQSAMPAPLSAEVVELFLGKMYSCQR